MPRRKADGLFEALHYVLASPNESDRNGEPANVVDGLFAIARAILKLAEAVDRATEQRALYSE
jgi:hypothetical protein